MEELKLASQNIGRLQASKTLHNVIGAACV